MKRPLLFLLTASASAGCLSTTSYGTARSLPEGELTHGLGLEFWVFGDKSDGAVGTPPWPSYTLRAGLSDELEIGGKITYPRLGVDLKYNPIRLERINVSGGIGAWVVGNHGKETGIPEPAVYTGLDLPILMDIMANDAVCFVPMVGPTLILAPQTGDASIGFRTGLGTRFILNDNFGLHPEVAFLFDPSRGGLAEMTFGFGFVFGPQPPPIDHEVGGAVEIGAYEDEEEAEVEGDEET